MDPADVLHCDSNSVSSHAHWPVRMEATMYTCRPANVHVTNCRLVFIGRNLDAEELNASFRDCLVDNLVISG